MRQAALSITAAAVHLLALAATSAQALITSSGSNYTYPGVLAIGPGDTDIGANTLTVGGGAPGSFSVTAGSQFLAASIRFGDNLGSGTGVFDGAGTRVTLTADGNSNRLDLGAWGSGQLTVSGGATLNGRANAAACLLGNHWCNNFVGNAAGSDASLTITGAGSNASFLRAFVVGGLAVFRPPIETFTFGTPGGTTQGRVQVLDGGLLSTDSASLGVAPGGSSPLGSERSFASVLIDGPGSIWRVTGGSLENTGANFATASHRNAWATVAISRGGRLEIAGPAGRYNAVNLSSNGGRSDMTVSGAQSAIDFVGDAGVLQVGQRLGTANMSLSDGGQVRGVWYVAVGRDGAFGELNLDGTDSLLSITGTASAAANGVATNARLDIGRNGTGTVRVQNGARIELRATEALSAGPQLSLGREAASSGRLDISGVGSVVSLSAASVLAGGGPGEAFNPLMRVGREGAGTLNILAGGKLLLEGQAVSTVADSRSTSLFIGGSSDTSNGGQGIALVSGVGSEIRLSGSDTYIGVGHGPQSSGRLTVADQAQVSAIGMNVGRSGGLGVLNVDHASLSFSGQQSGNFQSGAYLSIGRSGGVGVANIGNGSVLTLSNLGDRGASLNLGGTANGPTGDGSLTLSGGSQIHIQAAAGLAALSVAHDGSALMRVKGGSSVDVGDGRIFVGRLSGSDGTLLVSEGSSIAAGWVGVGRNKTSTGTVDGGTGTLVINNSTLTAADIYIGTNGFLGGNGVINGAVHNFGLFSPGNSPGTMLINGAFTAEAGSRLIMEVEGDASHGFKTDLLVFGEGSRLDLSALKVEFRFLGATDPNAFQASGGFDIDNFFHSRSAGGVDGELSHTLFATASFSAQAEHYTISGFSFTADGGAVFTAQAVPEPQTWVLLLAGLACLGLRRSKPAA
ncbi:hypothetical protein HNP55_000551 [Paucibacter oligotrophus]|uniref:Ice-binding protein C-terminal domain-containing protein n=1 Tax=Roseateles oligotrophus TaxID=1769250 RepID=A0A840L2B6_9BURK|nr:PEP-CTERM sorting domain-containing protein [Roseateles oligotrophus]MBB4842056.1 hypothetical protein [Roseateles oligotrophus]